MKKYNIISIIILISTAYGCTQIQKIQRDAEQRKTQQEQERIQTFKNKCITYGYQPETTELAQCTEKMETDHLIAETTARTRTIHRH